MTPNHAEVLSAFFDGQAVEAETLAAALQEPDAIDYLVEFARLRRAVHEDAERPTEEFCELMRERLAHAEKQRHTRHRFGQLSLAASLALAAALGGFTARGIVDRRPAAPGGEATRRGAPERPPATTMQPAALPEAPAPDARAPATRATPSPDLRLRFDEWTTDRVL